MGKETIGIIGMIIIICITLPMFTIVPALVAFQMVYEDILEFINWVRGKNG